MIRINLALKKQANYVPVKTGVYTSAGKGGGSLGSLAGLAPILPKILVPLALCTAAYFGYDYYVEEKIVSMNLESENLNKEKVKIQDELRRIKGFELVKAELDRNERVVRTKIETIEKLIRGRDFAVKTLVSLSQSLPREVWLTELTTNETGFLLKGGTTDIGLISDVMARMGESIYFKDVSLKNTLNDPTGKQATFELTARHE